jgi:hypothetical protein
MAKTLTSAFNIPVGKSFVWATETYVVKADFNTNDDTDNLVVTDSRGQDHNFNPYALVEEIPDA